MITETRKISNDIKVNYIKTEKFKTNYISFNFVSNLDKETSSINAMIPLILMRGTSKYKSQAELNKRLQYLYSGDIAARNDKLGEYQIFGIKANMLDNKYTNETDVTAEMVELVSEIIFEPYLENGIFKKEYVESEKTNLIDTIEATVNNKTSYATQRLVEEMCKNEVFSVSKYGTVENVKNITSEKLYQAYKKALEQCKIEIYYVGVCDFDKLVKTFEEKFAKIQRQPKELHEAKIVLTSSKVKQVVDTENVNQGKLCLGFRTGCKVEDKNYHVLQLFSELFGGSPTSKLFMNVREKMSLCYYCRSMVSQRNGLMIVSSGIEFKNKEIAEKAILEQLDNIKAGKITDEEFESAVKSLKNGYMQIYDDQGSMETWTFFRGMSGNTATPTEECEKISKLTIKDIVDISNMASLDTVYFLKGEK
jgi:predicted Zn-dependent peptidase